MAKSNTKKETTLGEMSSCLLLAIVGLAIASCSRQQPVPDDSGKAPASGYIEMKRLYCNDSIKLNGRWLLVNTREEGKNSKPAAKNYIEISDCSKISYYPANKYAGSDVFKLYKVMNYCADYQLVYKSDSISCINLRRDTLVFGECSTFESERYFYKRQ